MTNILPHNGQLITHVRGEKTIEIFRERILIRRTTFASSRL